MIARCWTLLRIAFEHLSLVVCSEIICVHLVKGALWALGVVALGSICGEDTMALHEWRSDTCIR
jgi:hypothetical protein